MPNYYAGFDRLFAMQGQRSTSWIVPIFLTVYSKSSHHVLVYCGTYYQYCSRFRLGYYVLSYQCWDIMYYPEFRARVCYTTLKHVLVYLVHNSRPWSRIRAIKALSPLSSFQPRSQI